MNKMTVRGDDVALAKFASRMNGEFSLEKILPTPQKLLERSPDASKGEIPEWYNWRLQHWGTKWDLRGVKETATGRGARLTFDQSGKSYTCEFDTAWHPPMIALENLSKQIPDLEIHLTYQDDMMNFTGRANFLNGESDFVFEEPASSDEA
jgi:hypothetical protein